MIFEERAEKQVQRYQRRESRVAEEIVAAGILFLDRINRIYRISVITTIKKPTTSVLGLLVKLNEIGGKLIVAGDKKRPAIYDAASGEWRVVSGEWRVASGEWRVASGEWRVRFKI